MLKCDNMYAVFELNFVLGSLVLIQFLGYYACRMCVCTGGGGGGGDRQIMLSSLIRSFISYYLLILVC